MAETDRCPNCGGAMPANAPQGLCAVCLLRQGTESEALSLSRPGQAGVTARWSEEVPPQSMLEYLKSLLGEVPSVLLRDTQTDLESPVVRPSSPEMPEDKGRYQLLGEIGHGGMGAVFKGRDPDLGRDLAVKVLLEQFQDDPEMTRRFVEEAQIGGQLQHPGIVPVYELGRFDERRPYFTMKLVKGRTLAVLLKERAGIARDVSRFLGIFGQVCQTMAYAHARGVIHRDLKPSNVMVGAFGEVQVMDWGLAKVLPQGGGADEPRPHPEVLAVSVIRTVRSDSDADASRPGSVLGTPAYMAPEQAGGDVELIDERTDVFGLGSILCEILTGQPAYTGSSFEAILRKARRGETADALRRLDNCGADAELIALARDCLAADPEERPRQSGEVVRRLTAYFAAVQERLRAAELARAAEEARAKEAIETAAAAERARAAEEARAEEARKAASAADGRARAERQARRMTVGLAASVLIAGALGAAGWRWVERDRMVRMAAISNRVNTALQEATGLRGQAQVATVGDLVAWTKALAAAQKARELLEPGLDLVLRGQAEALVAAITSEKEGAEAAARATESDRLLLDKLVDIRSARADDPDGSISDSDYTSAFRVAGIDVTTLPPAEVGARIKARPPPVVAGVVAALDDWAAVRRSSRADRPGALRLSETAVAADPDPWRVALRRALDLADRKSRAKALRDLSASTKPETTPAVDLHLLGTALSQVGEPKAAEEVLRAGRRRYPDDVWLNYDLARLLEARSRGAEAVRYYSIARALRPETAHELAHYLERTGESAEAVAVFRELVRLRPDDGRHWGCYGTVLKLTGDHSGSRDALEKAVAILRRSVQLKPDNAREHFVFGRALHGQGKPDEAIAAYRDAIRINPDWILPHLFVGRALIDQRKLAEALDACQNAALRWPEDAEVHSNLADALTEAGKLDGAIAECSDAVRLDPTSADYRNRLGWALQQRGKLDEAVVQLREAIRLDPEHAHAQNSLGYTLQKQGKQDEAIILYRNAIRINPEYSAAQNNLGRALIEQRKISEAVDAFRNAIRLRPVDAEAHSNLATALTEDGKLDEAVAERSEAVKLDPKSADYRNQLGWALQQRGKLDEAVIQLREAIRINPEHGYAENSLGYTLQQQGTLDDAVIHFRNAIRIHPDYAEAHCNLGLILRRQGHYEQALASVRRGHELGSKRTDWSEPSADWVRQCEHLVKLKARLPALLKGEEQPADNFDRLSVAQLCFEMRLYTRAVRLWSDAMTSDPKLVDNGHALPRYNAVCAAALAGSGKGDDDPKPDEPARTKIRAEARGWLGKELAAWAKITDSGKAEDRATVAMNMTHWRADPDLAGVRDADALAKLPEDERKAWQALWADVDTLLKKAIGK